MHTHPLLDTLRELELALQQPQRRSDPAGMAALLHADFREFGRSGRCYDRASICAWLAEAGAEAQPHIWAQDFVLEQLAEDIALLTYRSAHIDAAGLLTRHTNRSSLWQRGAAGWLLRFHQGTATEPFAPASR
jgi:hypothetical protein